MPAVAISRSRAMHALKALAIVVAALAGYPAWAVHKCVDSAGKTTYQEEPCPSGSKANELKIYDNAAQADYGNSGAYTGGAYSGSTYPSQSYRPSRTGPGDRTVHTGPRGGRYTITPSGNKNYIPRK